MKLRINIFRNSAAVSLAIVFSATSASAVTQFWTGAGEWTDSKWSNATGGAYDQPWNNTTADIAVFEGTGGAVTIASSRNVDRLDFNVTGYSLTAATPVTLTGIGATNYNLAANVTASIGANVTLLSSGAANQQSWNIKGDNKANSILNLGGVFQSSVTSTVYDATVNVNTGGQLISGSSIVVGTTTTNKGGTLNVAGTVSLASNASNLVLNNNAAITADSSITLSTGGAITFTDATNTGGLRFGPSGGSSNAATQLTGTFNLDGGTLTVNKVYMSSLYSGGATYNAAFNFNGGTLKALRDNNTDFMTGLIGTGAIVKSGGAIIDSNGKNVTIGQPLLDGSGGGLTKEGLGTLTLTGANTYTGDTIINGGKLGITAPYGAITATTINSGGRLKITSNGTTPSSLSTVSVNTGGGFEFDLGTFNALNQPAVSVGTLNANDNYTVDLAALSIPAGSHTITLLTFTTKTGSGLPSIGNLPSGVAVTSGPAYVGSSIQIGISAGNLFTWSKGDGDWDTTSSNWNANTVTYSEPAIVVTFRDLAEAGNGVNEVNVIGTRSPDSVIISNTGDFDTNAYSFSGSGISGSTGITKSGAGLVTLSNANSFLGTLAITGGAVIKTAADTTTGNITVADGGSFVLSGGITDGSGQTLTLAGPGAAAGYFSATSKTQRGSLQAQSGANVWDGDIILGGTAGTGGNTRIGVQDGASLTLNGNMSEGVTGMSPLFRAGDSAAETITINGLGSWTGTTRMFSSGGIIKLGGNDRFPTTAPLTVGTFASTTATVFDLAGFNQTVAGLTGDGTGRIQNSGGAAILTSNPFGAVTFAGIMESNIALAIGGTAIQSLSGANTYNGNTTVNTGGALTVTSTGELRFYPTTTGNTNSVGGAGTLLVSGILRIDLAGANTTAGNSWTLVDVTNLTETFDTTFKPAAVSLGDFTETALDSGIWKLTASGKSWTFTEADGKLTVADASGFTAWAAANAPGQTVDQDHDNDGVKNGIEYFMGLSGNAFTANPALNASNNITWTMGDDYTGTYGTDYLIQTSGDLDIWSPVAIGDVTIDNTAPGKSVSYTLTGAGKRFVRLLVNQD